jgi:hypothetical protein
LKVPAYLLLFWGLWNHYRSIIVIALCIEISLWFFIPPAAQTFNFIDNIVENELLWLKAKNDNFKALSLFLFFASVAAIMTGLWVHHYILIIMGLIGLILFNLIMNRIAKSELSKRAGMPDNVYKNK